MAKDKVFDIIIETVLNVTELERDLLFSCHKEEYCDTKSIVINLLHDVGYSVKEIGKVTGLSLSGVRYLKSTFTDRVNFRFMMKRNNAVIRQILNKNIYLSGELNIKFVV